MGENETGEYQRFIQALGGGATSVVHADGTCGGPMYCAVCQDQRSAAAPSRPDLSHLLATKEGRALYTRIVLAMIGGAEWKPVTVAGSLFLGLYAPGQTGVHMMARVPVITSGEVRATWLLLDPERDPAAAWDLMIACTDGVKFDSPDAVGLYWTTHPRKDGVRLLDEYPVPVDSAGRDRAARLAVISAALRKHASGPHADLIRPLLAVDHA